MGSNTQLNVDFFVVGGQKCGSTFVQEVLNEHPELFLYKEEVAFFEKAFYTQNSQRVSFEEIVKYMRSQPAKYIGIKRPQYLNAEEEIPERIFKDYPNSKIICVLRNPIARFKSAYFHYINYGFLPTKSINEGALDLLNNGFVEGYPRSHEILKLGLYSKGIESYRFRFKNNFKLFLFDDIIKNKLQVVKDCYSFLGVDPKFVPKKNINKKPQKVNYSLKLVPFYHFFNQFRFKTYADHSRIVKKNKSLVDWAFFIPLYFIDNQLIAKYYTQEKPTLSEEVLNGLTSYYKDDIQRTSDIIDRDLSFWLKK